MHKTQYLLLTLTAILITAMAPVVSLADQTNNSLPNSIASQGNSIIIQATGPLPMNIPDDEPSGINIEFDAIGQFTGPIESIGLEMGLAHTWIGDLTVTLTAPDGIAHLVVFSRIGIDTTSGTDSSDFSGFYNFSDIATADLWVTAENTDDVTSVPSGFYRTSTAGTILSDFGGCTTRLNGAFKGLTPQQTNGIWTLHISDHANADTGLISSAALIVEELPSDLIFESGFELIEYTDFLPLPASDTLGDCKKAQFDLTGNGLSDYVTSWEDVDEFLNVQTVSNQGTNTGSDSSFNTGFLFADTALVSSGDFDGDGIQDLVFRKSTSTSFPAFEYLVRRSSRPDDLLLRAFANMAETDTQIGDYDGDGLDDLAWFFLDQPALGQTQLSIRDSTKIGQPVPLDRRSLAFTNTGAGDLSGYAVAGGFDQNGDQVADIVMFVSDQNPSDPRYVVKVYDGNDGSELFESGGGIFTTNNAMVVPGTFVSPDVIDFAVYFSSSSAFTSYETDFAGEDNFDWTQSNVVPITGDYDGDGIDDFGIWDIDNLQFVIRPSGSVNPDNSLITVAPFDPYPGDVPLANNRFR